MHILINQDGTIYEVVAGFPKIASFEPVEGAKFNLTINDLVRVINQLLQRVQSLEEK